MVLNIRIQALTLPPCVAGPDLEGQPLSSFKADIVDSVEGDIFNLSSGRIAFAMPKRRYSFDELKSKLAGH